VEDTQPALHLIDDTGGPRVLVRGVWTADALSAPGVWPALEAQWRSLSHAAAAVAGVVWDLQAVSRLDHTGAQALWTFWGGQWPTQLLAGPVQQTILARIAHFSKPPPPPEPWSWMALLSVWGQRLVGVQSHLTGLLRMTGQLCLDVVQWMRHPMQGPWRDVSGHLYRIGATALPITALVGFLIGVVLAYLMSKQLRQYGADSFIVNILGLALIRELGPVLAAILVAGRSGSAITAQIGVMRVTEELDAMRVMGIAKGFRLVMPRTVALAIAMPLVAVWATLAALLGGMLAADLSMGLTPAYFVSALPKTVEVANLWLALGKSCVFGVLIALIACHHGLRVKPDTQSLGEGTTASVVSAITMVILVDALFAVVFKSVGL
jgi:phospholipid/cholesterol/gamma-HCH transport system permease protein